MFGALYYIDPALGFGGRWLSYSLIAADLTDMRHQRDCCLWPMYPPEGLTHVIGDRAYGTEPGQGDRKIARAVTEGLEQGGVLPVLKHIPGHGRATADTHFRLPEVSETTTIQSYVKPGRGAGERSSGA